MNNASLISNWTELDWTGTELGNRKRKNSEFYFIAPRPCARIVFYCCQTQATSPPSAAAMTAMQQPNYKTKHP